MKRNSANKGKTALRFLSVLLVACLLLGGVFGCSIPGQNGETGYTVAFKETSMTLIVGDTVTFGASDFTFSGTKPSSFSFRLYSNKSSVVSVSGNEITALAEGKATLTVTDKSDSKKTASCTITVTKEPDEINFALVTENRALRIGEDGEVDVYAQINEGKTDVSAYTVAWEINGSVAAYNGSTYTFPEQTSPVTKTVKATLYTSDGTYSDEIKLSWSNAAESAPELKKNRGSLSQESGSTTSVVYTLTSSYTDPVIDWFVDGEIKASDCTEFTFTPEHLGENTVTATVNGVQAVAENDENVVTVSGKAPVPASLHVDYDTLYPKVLVTFDRGVKNESYSLAVTNKSTNLTKTYDSGSNEIIIDDINMTTADFAFKVKSLGVRSSVAPSDYCEEITQSKITAEEKEYLDKSWYAGNYYITSDEEFFAIYDYFMLYRSKPLLAEDEAGAKDPSADHNIENYTDTHYVYLGYTPSVSIGKLVSEAFSRANYTGSYDMSSSQTGNVVTLKCKYVTSSSPAKTNTLSTVTQTALNATVPHVSKTGRASGASLPIDSVTKTVSVSTTDQLYRVLEAGYRPLPEAKSRAEEYYAYARKLLSSIIDDGMTDVEKAHAIYDWIMWRVFYDNTVTKVTQIRDAVTYGAFYIEGVLTDENYVAVCDGMSKTYSLLCNMEGVPCRRIAGTAGITSKGGHAWNKVMVDGKWYIVDCTWGDAAATVDGATGELATHAYFLKTDGELSATHEESEYNDYPQTTSLPYNYYKETAVGEQNAYIVSSADAQAYATALAGVAETELADGKVEYTYSTTTTQSSYYMTELAIAENAASTITMSSVLSSVKSALGNAYSVQGLSVGDSTIFLIKKKSASGGILFAPFSAEA